jgi:hypothetical protein
MELDQAIKTLDDLRRNDPVIQRGRNGELTNAFKSFWDSCPDEPTFSKHTAGLLITPTLLYYMVEHPIWMRKEEEVDPAAAGDTQDGAGKDDAKPAKTGTDKTGQAGGKHGNR